MVMYIVVCTIVYLGMLTTILLVNPLLRLPTSTIYPDILTISSPAYTAAIVKQSWAVAAVSTISACLNRVLSWMYGRDDGLGALLARRQNFYANQGNLTGESIEI